MSECTMTFYCERIFWCDVLHYLTCAMCGRRTDWSRDYDEKVEEK